MFKSLSPLISGFPMIALIFILILFLNWGLGPNEGFIGNILANFLEKRPIIRSFVEIFFNFAINILENSKEKLPNLATKIDNFIDILEIILEKLGLKNNRPILSNESPAYGTKHLSTNYPEVAITVKDPEGDPFDITIHGKYINNITKINQNNNTFIATLKNPLPNLTDIYWHVNVSYSQNKWINETYKFSTW